MRAQIIENGNTDMVHNGNRQTLRWLMKTHPISHVEQMNFDELKQAAVAILVERDEVTLQAIIDNARTRRQR